VLDLRENQIGPSVAETMAAREVFSCVRSVDFGYNALQDEGIGRLCASSWLPGIRQLTLTDNRIGDDGLIELAAHPRPLALETLDLARGSISDAGTRAILHSRCLGELRRIRLPVASLSERMFRLFREQYPVLAENGWFCRTTTEEPTR